jgi:hypothetical protein
MFWFADQTIVGVIYERLIKLGIESVSSIPGKSLGLRKIIKLKQLIVRLRKIGKKEIIG